MGVAVMTAMVLSALIIITFFMMLVTRSELGQLRREVRWLRAKLQEKESGDAAAPGDTTAPVAAAPPVAASPQATPREHRAPPPRPASPPRPRPAARPRATLDLEKLVGGQWLTWLGIIAIFLGAAFFLAIDLKDSALAGLPQVLIASVVALGFLAIGRGLVGGTHRFLGLGMLGGGIALLYLVAYGLFGFHQLVGAEIVFPALLAVAVFGALVALAQNSLTIAGLTLIGAHLTPLVLTPEQGASVALLPYLIAVDLGAVLVGRRRGWAGLPLGSFLGTMVLVAAWWGPHFTPELRPLVLAATSIIWLLYGLVPWLGQVRPGFWGLARTALVAVNATWYAGVVYQALGPELDAARGPALFAVAAVYVAASLVGGRGRRDDPAVIANFYVGAALAIVTVPLQFEGFSVNLAWALLGVLLLVMGWRLRDPHHRLAAAAGLILATVRVLLSELSGFGGAPLGFVPFFNLNFLTSGGVVAALFAAAWIERRIGDEAAGWEKAGRRLTEPLAAFTVWWLLTAETVRWLSAHYGSPRPVAALPLLWVAYALTAQALGRWRRKPWLRMFGFGSLVCAALAAFTVQAGNIVETPPGWHTFANGGFVAGLAVLAMLVWLARTYGAVGPDAESWESGLGTPLLLISLAYGLVVATLEMLAWFHARHGGDIFADGQALLSISLFWTLYAGALIWGGFAGGVRAVRLAGMSLLGLVIFKVFLVDMRALSAGLRIVSFVGVGALLLVISLLYQRERRPTGGDS